MRDYTYTKINLDPEPFVLEVSGVAEPAHPPVKEGHSTKNKEDPPQGENFVQLTTKDIKDLKITKVNLLPTEFILKITETKVYIFK